MKIVFAHPTHEYGSYRYFRELVELSGFESCRVEEMELSRDGVVYITSPANRALSDFLNFHDRRSVRAKVVYWNLERPDVPSEPVWNLPTTAVHAATETVLLLPGVAAAWVSDRHQATLDRFHKHVPLGGHPGIRKGPLSPQAKWDLCHFSYIWGRREVIRSIKKLSVAPEHFEGSAREEILCASRAILSIHQTPAPILEVLRSAWSAAYALPLICERVADPWPLEEGKSVFFVDHDTLQLDLERIFWAERLQAAGELRMKLLCETYNFRRCVEEGVKETFG